MKHMEKFPADVMHAERATGGDPDIVNSTDYLPQKKERHSGAFQDGRSPAGKGKGLKGTRMKFLALNRLTCSNQNNSSVCVCRKT